MNIKRFISFPSLISAHSWTESITIITNKHQFG
uniref:Uncharacterized protein n=1 Tax=Anguilla anguilla TaxID=7936 RepID=A0A0E9WKC4_ANGAN